MNILADYMILKIVALILACVADIIIGDPHMPYHPICLIGRLISSLEQRLYNSTDTRRRQLANGALMAFIVVIISTAVPAAIGIISMRISPMLFLVSETAADYFLIAARALYNESMRVYKALEKDDTMAARQAVSMIVGRDTEVLDRDGIIRAAVETVAENASDGVVAPMIYIAMFGSCGGFFYKSVNTMDSMVGYVNDRYEAFGKTAARADDVLNFIPSRITAILMIIASPLTGLDMKNAWHIFIRDRLKHASPNSAQTESVCAGALNVRLAGDAWYGGILHKKEYIGDDNRPINPGDIISANHLMLVTEWLALIIVTAVNMALY